MTQDDLDALAASGLKPIVIDEDFDFNTLNGLFNEQVGQRITQAATDGSTGAGLSAPGDPAAQA